MARDDNPHLHGEPDGGPAKQREILAQFEAAIAGMHTREIQLGLRQLLAEAAPPPPAEADDHQPAVDAQPAPAATGDRRPATVRGEATRPPSADGRG